MRSAEWGGHDPIQFRIPHSPLRIQSVRGRTRTGYGLLEGQSARTALHSRTKSVTPGGRERRVAAHRQTLTPRTRILRGDGHKPTAKLPLAAGGLRACLQIQRGPVFAEKPGWRDATKENIPGGSSAEEQRSQAGFSAKTLRAAGLLPVGFVGSVLTARCGDARPSPPHPQPKSPAAEPLSIFKHALNGPRGW
jgi:hypothetical protein